MSNCISEGPENWINEWKHNDRGFYNSEEIMMQVLKEYKEKYNFFAYKLYPLIFINGVIKDYKISLNLKTILSDYNLLGFDIVSRSKADFFECSPLSCNNACEVYSVNRYCLIDKIEDAYNYCLEIEKGKWEPGPYYLFEVYRKNIGQEINRAN